MSVKIMSAVFESLTLGPTDRLVMLSLADHAGEDGTCYPSIARLCQRTGLGERAVQASIKRLRDAEYVSTKVGGGRGHSTLYTITINPALETPFKKPRFVNPVSDDINPAFSALNPAADAPEPSVTIIEPSEKKGAKDLRGILDMLRRVVREETAQAFIAHRKAKRSPLTLYAAELIAKKLIDHPDADAVLLTSVENGWTGVFPEKFRPKGQANGQADRRQFDAAINETARRLSEGTIHIDHSSRDPFAAR
jgi:DNA-binding transcriptional ArsR family regulator